MKNRYRHLNQDDRDQIAVWRSQGQSMRAIAHVLGRNAATVSRELRRNSASIHQSVYFSHKAHQRARQRWIQSHERPRLANPVLRTYVKEKLTARWSPELIAGRLRLDLPGQRLSHEAIYQWIYHQAPELAQFLTRARPRCRLRWKRRRPGNGGLRMIPERVSIRHRPRLADLRRQWGHWEVDTMVDGYRRAAVQVLVERRSRFACLTSILPLNPRTMRQALTQRLRVFPLSWRRTLTYDNGGENSGHRLINSALGTRSFFCDPYHSWQRGTVENTIGLTRRWLPKKTDLTKITGRTVRQIEHWLNHRPRKCLNYRTPAEALRNAGVALTS